MLRLLACPVGHFWESTAADDVPSCPECGRPADLAPVELAPEEIIPVVQPIEPPLFDERGLPIIEGYDQLKSLGQGSAGLRRFQARQIATNRLVLLEVVVAKDDTGQRGWGVLRSASSALGKLSHPNIVHIFEAGERQRQLFYNALELVEGPTLAEKADDRLLSVPQIVHLMQLVARAIDHAHDHGIIHRNLRPSAILLQPVPPAENDIGGDSLGAACSLPGGCYVPLITDFGRWQKGTEGEPADVDLYGDELGFLSPEQAWGRQRDLGKGTDIYGLGALLYFLLAGRPPFRGPNTGETLDAIQTADLISPRQMRRVPEDLAAICRKCLYRQPRRRYRTAGEMADDLWRFSRGLPVKARDNGKLLRLGKWAWRQPLLALFLVMLGLGALGCLVSFGVGYDEGAVHSVRARSMREELHSLRQQADTTRERLQALEQQERMHAYQQMLVQATRELKVNNNLQAQATLQRCPGDQRGFEWYYLFELAQQRGKVRLGQFSHPITALAISPRGLLLAAAYGSDGKPGDGEARKSDVAVYDLSTRTLLKTLTDSIGPVHALTFSATGQMLIGAGGNERDTKGELRAWNMENEFDRGKLVYRLAIDGPRLTGILADAGDQYLFVVNDKGSLSRRKQADGAADNGNPFPVIGGTESRRLRLAMPPRGTMLAYALETDTTVTLWSLNENRQTTTFPGLQTVDALAFSANNRLAVARADGSVTVHDLGKGTPHTLSGVPAGVKHLAFSTDGNRLVASTDTLLAIWAWGGTRWTPLLTIADGAGRGVAFCNNNKALITAGDKEVNWLGTVN